MSVAAEILLLNLQTNLQTPTASRIREKKKVKTREENNMGIPRSVDGEGGGRGDAPCFRAEILLQTMVKTTVHQTDCL